MGEQRDESLCSLSNNAVVFQNKPLVFVDVKLSAEQSDRLAIYPGDELQVNTGMK